MKGPCVLAGILLYLSTSQICTQRPVGNELHTGVSQIVGGLALMALFQMRISVKIHMCLCIYTYVTEFQNLAGMFHGNETKCVLLSLGLFKRTGNQNSCREVFPLILIRDLSVLCSFVHRLHFLIAIMNGMNWPDVFSEKMLTVSVPGHSTLFPYPPPPTINRILPLPGYCFFCQHLQMFPHCQPPCHTKCDVWGEREGLRCRIQGAGFLFAGPLCTKAK